MFGWFRKQKPQPATPFPCYEILGELGHGTTGVVYRARDTRLNRAVALKVLAHSPDTNPVARSEQFLRECRVLASITGGPLTGIPLLHEVNEYSGQQYYTRELVEGSTLERWAAVGSIDMRAGLSVVAAVARVVQGVHERGFVHRNMSAANVLVGQDGTAWLIGFGRVGYVAGSQPVPAGATGTPVEVDVRGLQELVRWLYGAVRQPVPADMQRVIAPGAVPTAGALGEALVRAE